MSKQFQTCLHPLWTGLVHQFGKLKGCHMMSPTHHFSIIGSIWQSNCIPKVLQDFLRPLPRDAQNFALLCCVATWQSCRWASSRTWREPSRGIGGSETFRNLSRPEGWRRIKDDQRGIKICSKHFQSTCAIIIQASSISRIKQHWNCTMLHSNA